MVEEEVDRWRCRSEWFRFLERNCCCPIWRLAWFSDEGVDFLPRNQIHTLVQCDWDLVSLLGELGDEEDELNADDEGVRMPIRRDKLKMVWTSEALSLVIVSFPTCSDMLMGKEEATNISDEEEEEGWKGTGGGDRSLLGQNHQSYALLRLFAWMRESQKDRGVLENGLYSSLSPLALKFLMLTIGDAECVESTVDSLLLLPVTLWL